MKRTRKQNHPAPVRRSQWKAAKKKVATLKGALIQLGKARKQIAELQSQLRAERQKPLADLVNGLVARIEEIRDGYESQRDDAEAKVSELEELMNSLQSLDRETLDEN